MRLITSTLMVILQYIITKANILSDLLGTIGQLILCLLIIILIHYIIHKTLFLLKVLFRKFIITFTTFWISTLLVAVQQAIYLIS